MPDVEFYNTGTIRLYSSDIEWTRNVPQVTTDALSEIDSNSIQGEGSIVATGGETLRRGFCYIQSPSGDPTILDSYVEEEGEFFPESFEDIMETLTSGSNYRVRAFVENSAGIGYGDTLKAITDLLLSDKPAFTDSTGEKGSGKALSDALSLLDALIKLCTHEEADELALSDASVQSPSVSLSDQASLQDSLENKSPSILKTDGIQFDDSQVKQVSPVLSDNLSLQEDTIKSLQFHLSDQADVQDSQASLFARPLADSVQVQDEVYKQPSLSMSEEAAFADDSNRHSLPSLFDNVDLSDQNVKIVGSLVEDELALSDSIVKGSSIINADEAYIFDGIIKHPSALMQDNVQQQDAIINAFNKLVVDETSFVDFLSSFSFLKHISSTISFEDDIRKTIFIVKEDIAALSEFFVADFSFSLEENIVLLDQQIKGPSLLKEDNYSFADDKSLSFVKSVQDQVAWLTWEAMSTTITLTDRADLFDVFNANFVKLFVDRIKVSDGRSFLLNKRIAEQISMTDQASTDLSKLISSVIYLDDLIKATKKTDNLSLYRDIVTTLSRIRNLTSLIKTKSTISAPVEKAVVPSVKQEVITSNTRIRQILCIPVILQKEVGEMLEFSPKQAWEEYYIVFNFVRVVTPETEIEEVEITVEDEDGLDVTDELTDQTKTQISGTKVSIWVRGGSEQVYKITSRVTMDNGEKFEQDAELEVTEE